MSRGLGDVYKRQRLGRQYRCHEPVRVVLKFSPSERGRVRVTGVLETSLQATCQRCLESVIIDIEQDIAVELMDVAGFQTDHVTSADEFDEAVEYQGKLNLHELIEDELVLACPIVPQHAVGECAEPDIPESDDKGTNVSAAPTAPPDDAPGDKRKPFARLAELIDASEKKTTE